jgi:hypothetical protein
MNARTAVVWIFVIIFVATAVIALGSLPGWISVPDYYRTKLFALLILEVVACTIGFGREALKSYEALPQDLRAVLLRPDYGWDWQYAQKSWRSRIRFESVGGPKMTFTGDTFVVDPAGNNSAPIIHWESVRPFEVARGAKAVTFDATRTWTQAAADKYPELKFEVGKKNNTRITFQLDYAVHGSATDPHSTKPWGIMLTTAFPD